MSAQGDVLPTNEVDAEKMKFLGRDVEFGLAKTTTQCSDPGGLCPRGAFGGYQ